METVSEFMARNQDLADLARIFRHEVVFDQFSGSFCWKRNEFVAWLADKYMPFNDVWELVQRREQQFPIEEVVKFYMQVGYSLDGFGEIFSKPVWVLGFNSGVSIIDWLRNKYKGRCYSDQTDG